MAKLDLSKVTYAELANEFYTTRSDEAFKNLYEKIYPNIRNYVLKIVQDEDAANDVVSNTMFKLYTRIDEYDKTYQITTWLYTIAYHDSIQFIRERNSRVSLSYGYEVSENTDNSEIGKKDRNFTDFYEHDIDEIKDDSDYEKEQNEKDDQYSKLLDAIHNLKPIYKCIMVERFLNGLSYRQIEEKFNEEYKSKYNDLCDKIKVAYTNGDKTLFNTLKSERDEIKKNMITEQTVKNRIARGRKILSEIMGIELV